jgi:hypothetical protein
LDDDGKLVDEKVIRGMYHYSDKVEMILAQKIVEYVFVTVLAERPNEGGTVGSDPAVKG